ncbi:uncharacterized protein MYCGRDRAFT_97921 [Zymoseptoria tritici IPO323]|uniref:JmjC domain-containing protein n=1 Tax=Zymoseptoria tritici (strain CBS 115943 / IPO323) TaxID=336722 RepID=F9XRS5_ZYMTI|nr:uncharacterized protein MYCGRDRAFT_97921 [Zymoseptoria tritici IPO323]EGP82046.1 hypothetical protein MYCGRDRAFT_97921 [Zymoseptoria tritici IPO323]
MNVQTFAKRLECDIDTQEERYNALNLASFTHADKPTFTKKPRFQFLSALSKRAKKIGPGKEQTEGSRGGSDVDRCETFNILAEPTSTSFAHVDVLGGTYVRCLFGVKLWMIVPEKDMSEDDRASHGRKGDEWLPEGKARLILLRKGDVLFMPPGLRQVHAVFTPETCLMEGGMLWDQRSILATLKSLLWVYNNPAATNEDLPRQLRVMLEALQKWMTEEPDLFPDHVEIRETIQSFEELGCGCHGQCRASCPCKGNCTIWRHTRNTTRKCVPGSGN